MPKKSTNFFKILEGNFRSAWGNGVSKGSVRQFSTYWKEMKRQAKGNSKKKHSKARAAARMVRARGVNGPELNILFLGLPIIVHSFAMMGVNAARNKKQKKLQKSLARSRDRLRYGMSSAGGRDGAIEVEINQPTISTGRRGGGSTPPLPSSPYSDQFVPMQAALIDMGMSSRTATSIAAGEFEGEDLADHLTEDELEIFAAYLSQHASVSEEGV